MKHTVSAIIVNYNAGSLLRGCVDSLLACPLAIEVIVVDNGSYDGSIVGLPDSVHIRVIRNETNVGFAVACNIGICASTANTLLFLNPDGVLAPSAMCHMMKALESKPSVGMVGGLLMNEDGSEQGGGRRAVPTPWRSFVRAVGLYRFTNCWPRLFYDFYLHKQPLPKVPIEVEVISGACMLVKRKAVVDVGLWDEGYFLHCEDLDWCMRFRQKGWNILFVPDAHICHVLGACSRSRRVFVEWHKHKGMVRFYRKFFRRQYPDVLMWLLVLGVWLRFVMVATYLTIRRLLAELGVFRG